MKALDISETTLELAKDVTLADLLGNETTLDLTIELLVYHLGNLYVIANEVGIDDETKELAGALSRISLSIDPELKLASGKRMKSRITIDRNYYSA
jgi:hypothetical protein